MKSLLKLALLIFVGSQLLACSEIDTAECRTSSILCITTNQFVQSCCSSDQCEYRTGEQTFLCAGTSCTSTVDTVYAYCGITTKNTSQNEIDLSKALLIEKADNIYLRKSIDQMYNDLGTEVQ